MHENQVDLCGKKCAGDCPSCAGRFEIDFRPRDVRMTYMMGGADPKLDGEGAPGGKTYE
jgi:hypothetical protein